MIRVLIIIGVFFQILSANSSDITRSIAKTLQQIEIESKLSGKGMLNIAYDPFFGNKKIAKASSKSTKKRVQKKRIAKKRRKSLVLSMILNNKAFINGKWYGKNQKVEHYMLKKIDQDSVVLVRKNKTIKLRLYTVKNLLHKKEVL